MRRGVGSLALGLGFAAGAIALPLAAPSIVSAAPPFEYLPPGDLIPGSGEGYVTEKVYVPGMRFPLEEGPAYPNSQVYGVGGSHGPPGWQCDAVNFDYPWRDNFCETRSWTDGLNLCPLGKGHQGQDIRAATCEDQVHWIVAAQGGSASVGDFMVYVTTPEGVRHRYGHGRQVAVWDGKQVVAGERLAKVSNRTSGGGSQTSYHLHYDIRMDVAGHGSVYVPPYTSLLPAYVELMDFPGYQAPRGHLDVADCDAIAGWAQDLDVADESIQVDLYFDGPPGEGLGASIAANLHRDDLCEAIGSCAHGFASQTPRSLRDGQLHSVEAHGIDAQAQSNTLLVGSPKEFSCAPLPVPDGRRRPLPSPEHLAAWDLSPFWDATIVAPEAYVELPQGAEMSLERDLIREAGSEETYLVDEGSRRLVGPQALAAWHFSEDEVRSVGTIELQSYPLGPPLPDAPFLVSDGASYALVDVELEDCELTPEGCGEETGGEGETGGDSDDGGVGGDSGTTGPVFPAEPGDAGACACSTPGGPSKGPALPLMLAVVVLGRLRRGR